MVDKSEKKRIIMPDITMCKGEGCKLKETCYRFKAKPSDYQAYFVKSPIKYGKCDYFAEIWTKEKKSSHKR